MTQTELAKELGTDVKREYNDEVNDEDLRKQIHDELYQPAYDTIHKTLPKQERNDAFDKIIADFIEKYDAAHTDLRVLSRIRELLLATAFALFGFSVQSAFLFLYCKNSIGPAHTTGLLFLADAQPGMAAFQPLGFKHISPAREIVMHEQILFRPRKHPK